MTTTSSTQMSTLLIEGSAAQADREACELIQRAHAWAVDFTTLLLGEHDTLEMALRERGERVTNMRRSYADCWLQLIRMSQNWDGPLHVFRDSEACLFWRHESSGYCGGVIFHADHANGERLPVGTWSIHT